MKQQPSQPQTLRANKYKEEEAGFLTDLLFIAEDLDQDPYYSTDLNSYDLNSDSRNPTPQLMESNIYSQENLVSLGHRSRFSHNSVGSSGYLAEPALTKAEVFVRDSLGWSCRYCHHLPLALRAPGSVSQDAGPPNKVFVEQHLAVCRGNEAYRSAPFPISPTVEGSPPLYGGLSMTNKCYQAGYRSLHQTQQQHNPNNYYAATNNTVAQPTSTLYQFENYGNTYVLRKDNSYDLALPNSQTLPDLSLSPDPASLAREPDRLLLTDYYYYIMQQLTGCKFTDRDRKTRGGKRDNIPNGYGGIVCKHCSNRPNARKFFWSDVDRIANSFAEIPSHILKCRRCPVDVKDNLLNLKSKHKEQMARTPRGSQKVFFRRLWRRIQDDENTADLSSLAGASKEDGTVPVNDGKVRLSISDDREWLSDLDCFVRSNIEVFIADEEDVNYFRNDKKVVAMTGNVGLRCVHCAHLKHRDRTAGACYFPKTISSIYENTRDFQKSHLTYCPHLPLAAKEKLLTKSTSSSLTSVLRRYYILSAKALGMVDTHEGIKAAKNSQIVVTPDTAVKMDDQAEASTVVSTLNDDDVKSHQRKRSLEEGETTRDKEATMNLVGDAKKTKVEI